MKPQPRLREWGAWVEIKYERLLSTKGGALDMSELILEERME